MIKIKKQRKIYQSQEQRYSLVVNLEDKSKIGFRISRILQ